MTGSGRRDGSPSRGAKPRSAGAASMWLNVVIGAVAAVAAATFVAVFGAGVYWLWLFGDDPWPAWAINGLVAGSYAIGAAVFIGFVVRGIRSSRQRSKREEDELPGSS